MNAWKQFPQRGDPRVAVAAILLVYVALGISVLGFNRTPAQFAITVGAAMLLDMALHCVLRGGLLFPLSALITGLGLSILMNYAHGWWYALVPVFLASARNTYSHTTGVISTTPRCSVSRQFIAGRRHDQRVTGLSMGGFVRGGSVRADRRADAAGVADTAARADPVVSRILLRGIGGARVAHALAYAAGDVVSRRAHVPRHFTCLRFS
jgi:hypothetical protein